MIQKSERPFINVVNWYRKRTVFTGNVAASPEFHVMHDSCVVKDRFNGDRQLLVHNDVVYTDTETHVSVHGCWHPRRRQTQRLPEHSGTCAVYVQHRHEGLHS